MSGAQIGVGTAGAVFIFWLVGAHNRLVRLRSALVARFASIEAHGRQRQALLDDQIEVVQGALVETAAPRLEALRAACQQAEAARERARLRPAAAAAITSLRVAEEILADARARLPVQSVGKADLPALNSRLAESDAALAFAQREFNASVVAYNEAAAQFPTVLVARMFRFPPAATL